MRIRIYYQKSKELKFTSVLDVQTIWQRSVRRAGLPLEYSQGFHPRPRMQVPFPLPLGFTAKNEIIDLWLVGEFNVTEVEEKLSYALPVGIKIQAIEKLNDQKKSDALSAVYADYAVKIFGKVDDADRMRQSIDQLLASSTVIRERNGKIYDLRPLILSLEFLGIKNNTCHLKMRLNAHPSMVGRPDEVMEELGVDISDCEFERLDVCFNV